MLRSAKNSSAACSILMRWRPTPLVRSRRWSAGLLISSLARQRSAPRLLGGCAKFSGGMTYRISFAHAMSDDTPSPLNNENNVITIDDERIKSHLDRVVRGTVEETLNALLDAEADRLCNAQRYERSEARRDIRAGHYERGLQKLARYG